jgi:hypothetical protein
MGYEAGAGQPPAGLEARQPEVVSPYAGIGHEELIDEFYEADGGDPAIGKELSARLLRHAGFTGDPNTTPLIGRDGTRVVEDGRPLVLADYINFAAAGHTEGHLEALDEILGFLDMGPGQQDYESMRAGMMRRLNPSAG